MLKNGIFVDVLIVNFGKVYIMVTVRVLVLSRPTNFNDGGAL